MADQGSGLRCRTCREPIGSEGAACAACGAGHHASCLARAGHCADCLCAKAPVPFLVAVPAVPASPPARRKLVAGLAALVLVLAVPLTLHHSPPRQAISRQDRCRPGRGAMPIVSGVWKGRIHGNDPDVLARMVLVQHGRMVQGELIWKSRNSGTSRRTIVGYVDPDQQTVILKDRAVTGRCAPGWRFCKVDYYLLKVTRRGHVLRGGYWSSACGDSARVTLRRER